MSQPSVLEPEPTALRGAKGEAGMASDLAYSPPVSPPAVELDDGATIAARARNLILLDYDDTLLASTWLTEQGQRVDDTCELPDSLVAEMRALEDDVVAFLSEAQSRGHVVVVTNAETGWLEMSSARFAPRIGEMLSACGVQVRSARSTFECDYPNSPTDWKREMFLWECDAAQERSEQFRSVISIGDSLNEREAAHFASTQRQAIHAKTVKFVERPSVEQLRRQLALLTTNLQEICAHDGAFDVNLVC